MTAKRPDIQPIDEFAVGLSKPEALLWRMYQMIGQGKIPIASKYNRETMKKRMEEVEEVLGI